MSDKIVELKSDIKELESLQAQATRPKVRDILNIEIRKLASEVIKFDEDGKNFEAEGSRLQNVSISSNAELPKRYQVKLNNYAWDQTSKHVKFYVTLQKVHTIPSENISCDFTAKSLELNVKGLENKDYILLINKLLNSINPESSSWKIKTDMIIISAAKKDSTNWSHVTELEKHANDSKKKLTETDKSADPSEGLMSIMRNMYEQGDDEMKRTIAKAWTESQSKGPTF